MGWSWFSSSSNAPQTTTPASDAAKLQQMLLDKQTLKLEIEKLQKQEMAARPHGPAGASPETTTSPQHQHQQLQRTPQEQFQRGAKQAALFFAGAGFLAASVMISRRSISRKMIDSFPKFYQPSHHGPRPPPRAPKDKADDQLVAVEALGLATLNVFSFGVMMTGGLMFACDISNLEELRHKARKNLYGANGVVDEAAEQQVEEWIADVLSRKDKRDEHKQQGSEEEDNKSG